MTKFLYGLCLLFLLLLSVAFASFFLVTFEQLDFLQEVVDRSTAYLPVLLVPTVVGMVVLLLLRYFGKDEDEKVGFGDLVAAVIAVGAQVAVLIVWRAQGNQIAGSLAANVPDIEFLSSNASRIGVMGVAALQLVAFYFYWKAGPDRRRDEED